MNRHGLPQYVHALSIQLYEGEQQHGEGHQRGTPVAKEGQGNADYRGQPHGHTHVNGKVEEEDGHHAVAKNACKFRALPFGHDNKAKQQYDEHHYHHEAAYKAPFLPNGAEDEIGGLLRHKIELGLGALQKPLACKAT